LECYWTVPDVIQLERGTTNRQLGHSSSFLRCHSNKCHWPFRPGLECYWAVPYT
jgi:hypothetical protein